MLRPIPAFEEHSILPNVLHDDAQANLISVPLAEVDQFYGEKEVIIECLFKIFLFCLFNEPRLINRFISVIEMNKIISFGCIIKQTNKLTLVAMT